MKGRERSAAGGMFRRRKDFGEGEDWGSSLSPLLLWRWEVVWTKRRSTRIQRRTALNPLVILLLLMYFGSSLFHGRRLFDGRFRGFLSTCGLFSCFRRFCSLSSLDEVHFIFTCRLRWSWSLSFFSQYVIVLAFSFFFSSLGTVRYGQKEAR